MKFRIEDIPAAGREEVFQKEGTWLDERLAAEKGRIFRFIGPIVAHLNLARSGRVIVLTSRIEVQVEWLCARCLDPFPLTVTSKYGTSLKPKPSFFRSEEVELTREDLETDFYEGEEIDVSPLVQDQVLLALPPKAVCKEECRGLCPYCGKNLNREDCQCAEKRVDPRLDPLRKFLDH